MFLFIKATTSMYISIKEAPLLTDKIFIPEMKASFFREFGVF